jgi:hypothetical protein
MRMGIVSRSQPMSWERRQCSWEEQQVAPGFKWKPAEPQPMGMFRKNVGIHTRYYKNCWAGILTKKPSLYINEVRSFVIILFS